MKEELTQFSAAALAALVRAREVSPVEVAEAYLRRVERLNPRLNAVVTVAHDFVEQARRLEARLARGESCGPLAGVPVTVKDTIETADLRTTYGSRLFTEHVPRSDAPAVALLRAAGALILGKTNVSELALDYTADNPVHGRTNNPVDTSLTPGGSSGGCAAAVGAGLSAASVGSDLVGSLRVPAHFCGVASIRPTTGRIDGRGHLPPVAGAFARGATLGPIARRVEDLELLLDVLTTTGSHPPTHASFAAELRGVRIAWYTFDGATPVTRETREAVAAAAGALKDAGLVCVESTPPHVGRANELWLRLFSRATTEFLRETYAGREDEAGPAARLLLGRAGSGAGSAAEYAEACEEVGRARAELLAWMEATPLLVCPVGAVAAPPHDARKVSPDGLASFGLFRAFSYAQAFNVFDLPAACVRAGRDARGLPVGVQIVGRPGAERQVLAAARIVEEVSGEQ